MIELCRQIVIEIKALDADGHPLVSQEAVLPRESSHSTFEKTVEVLVLNVEEAAKDLELKLEASDG